MLGGAAEAARFSTGERRGISGRQIRPGPGVVVIVRRITRQRRVILNAFRSCHASGHVEAAGFAFGDEDDAVERADPILKMELKPWGNFAFQKPLAIRVVDMLRIARQEHRAHGAGQNLSRHRDSRGGSLRDGQDVGRLSAENGQHFGTQFQASDLRKGGRKRDGSRQQHLSVLAPL